MIYYIHIRYILLLCKFNFNFIKFAKINFAQLVKKASTTNLLTILHGNWGLGTQFHFSFLLEYF